MPFDPMTGEFFTGNLEDFRKAAAGVGGLFAYAARPELLRGYVQGMMTQISIAEGTTGVTMGSAGSLIGTGAGGAAMALVLPVVTMVGVWVALGSGYYQAREQAKSKESMSGFSQGLVMGVLEWTQHQAFNRLGRRFLRINAVDGQMDVIRVTSYNGGLKTGFTPTTCPRTHARRIEANFARLPAVPLRERGPRTRTPHATSKSRTSLSSRPPA